VAVSTTSQADPELSAARQAVLAAQQQVDTDLAAAQQALDDAQAVCAAVTAPADPTPEATASTVPDDSDSSVAVAACQASLDGVLDTQQVVNASQSALAGASRALDRLLSDRAAATASPGADRSAPATGSPTPPRWP
jgi:hypothetical protein